MQAGLAACSFSLSLSPGSEPDGSIEIPCDAPTLSCGDAVTLVASCTGTADVTETCPWGCLDNAPFPRCGKLVPGGGAVIPADLEPTNDFSLSGTLDGEAGEINGSSAGSLGIAFRQGSNNVAIFRFKNLMITGPLKLQGNRAIALVASGDIMINGIVDVRGPCNAGAGRTAGPGGGDGGSESNGSGVGGGSGSDTSNRGGGGGGHGARGGSGAGGVNGGIMFGSPELVLVGGAGGGGAKTSEGGGGGGALQLVSNRAIAIAAGAGINAGGCGGGGGDNNTDAGGGGGGGGGALLLEAPRLTVAGTLAVNGGAGGARGALAGSAGRLDRTRATGPVNAGLGGAGSTPAGGSGAGAGNNQENGGGGGAVGRIRLHTGTGAASELVRAGTTVLSPDTTDPMSTTVHVRANVQ